MDAPLRIEDWVKTEIAKQLAAIEAAGWDEAKQGNFIRLLIEQGIDELEAAENEHYDFLADCLALASENMQDARLQALEQRIGALENPPFNLAQTLLDLSPREKTILYPLIVLVIFFGVYPAPVFDATAQSVKALVTDVTASLNAAQTASAN